MTIKFINARDSREYPPIVRVDELGNVLGPVWYLDAHPKDKNSPGIRHSTVNGLIFEDTSFSRVLISQRGNVSSPGKYDASFGGCIDWNIKLNRPNSPLETAERETQEELFYKRLLPLELRLNLVGSYVKDQAPNNPEFTYLFTGVYAGPFFPDPDEVAGVKFFPFPGILDDIALNPNNYTRNLPFVLGKFLEVSGIR